MTHQYKPLHLHVIIPVSADPHKLPARSLVTRLPKTGCSAPPYTHTCVRARRNVRRTLQLLSFGTPYVRACVRANMPIVWNPMHGKVEVEEIVTRFKKEKYPQKNENQKHVQALLT